MKTTELRLGNFIQDHFYDIITVAGLDDVDVFSSDFGDIPVHAVQPIPLNEQWLLDLGLKKYTGRYGVYYKHYALDGFRVWLPRDIYGWGYTVGRKDYETGDTYWVKNEVRYVHQLQNLYFALAQEELILKKK